MVLLGSWPRNHPGWGLLCIIPLSLFHLAVLWFTPPQLFGSLLSTPHILLVSYSFIVLILSCGGGLLSAPSGENWARAGGNSCHVAISQAQCVLESHPYLTESQSWEDYLKHVDLVLDTWVQIAFPLFTKLVSLIKAISFFGPLVSSLVNAQWYLTQRGLSGLENRCWKCEFSWRSPRDSYLTEEETDIQRSNIIFCKWTWTQVFQLTTSVQRASLSASPVHLVKDKK